MKEKIDKLLKELEARYGMDESFSAKVRPLVEKIVDPSMPEEARPGLLTDLADLYESQAQIRRSCADLTESIHVILQNEFNQILGQIDSDKTNPQQD